MDLYSDLPAPKTQGEEGRKSDAGGPPRPPLPAPRSSSQYAGCRSRIDPLPARALAGPTRHPTRAGWSSHATLFQPSATRNAQAAAAAAQQVGRRLRRPCLWGGARGRSASRSAAPGAAFRRRPLPLTRRGPWWRRRRRGRPSGARRLCPPLCGLVRQSRGPRRRSVQKSGQLRRRLLRQQRRSRFRQDPRPARWAASRRWRTSTILRGPTTTRSFAGNATPRPSPTRGSESWRRRWRRRRPRHGREAAQGRVCTRLTPRPPPAVAACTCRVCHGPAGGDAAGAAGGGCRAARRRPRAGHDLARLDDAGRCRWSSSGGGWCYVRDARGRARPPHYSTHPPLLHPWGRQREADAVGCVTR